MPPTATPVVRRIDLGDEVETVYFQVSGTTVEEIFASLEANGPTDDEGEIGLGLTAWAWTLPLIETVREGEECVLETVTTTIEFTVTLPELTNYASLPASTQQRWDALYDEIATHEQRHVDIVVEGLREVGAEIEAIEPQFSCNSMEAEVVSLWREKQAEIDDEQEAFHVEDKARIEALRAPLEAQVDANNAQIASLGAELDALDAQLESLKASVDSLSAELSAIDAEIEQIESDYPSQELPPDVYNRYQSLINQYNAKLSTYNSLIDDYNATLDQRNELADQHDALVATTNALIEDLNWLR